MKGNKPAGLFGIVANHHGIVIELREDGFNAFFLKRL